MTIFEILVVAHVVGDWLLQTEWQAVNKTRSWRALMSHVLVYHAVLLALVGMKVGYRDSSLYLIVVSLAVVHGFLDRNWPLVWLMRTLRITVLRTPERWLTVAVDQAVHLVLLAAAALYLSRGAVS